MTTLEDRFATEESETEQAEIRMGHSFLIAEVGHVTTMVTLYDVVEGGYKLIARGSALTTARDPWHDVMPGIRQATEQVGDATGRKLLTNHGHLIRPARADGVGVDHFGALVNFAEPLGVIVSGLVDDTSLASARRALETIYAEELDAISVTDLRSKSAHLQSLFSLSPDLVFVTGGTDGGASEQVMAIVESLAIGIGLMDDNDRPDVLYAGNAQLRQRVNDAFSELTTVRWSDNVRPAIEIEQLDTSINQLADLYVKRKIAEYNGIDDLAAWCSFPLKTTAQNTQRQRQARRWQTTGLAPSW